MITPKRLKPQRLMARLSGFRLLGVTLALVISFLLAPVPPAVAQESGAEPTNVLDNKVFLPLITDVSCDLDLGYRSTPFGLQVYGATGRSTPYHCSLVLSGATWVRTGFSWRDIEPTNTGPNDFQWAAADSAFTAAGDTHINIIANMMYNPRWAANASQGPIDKTSLDEFAEFMGAVTERYDGDGVNDAPGSPRVLYWELYNEPDAGDAPQGTRWGHYGEAYAQMLAAVYPAVKAANPQAQVVLGGIAYDWFEDQNGPFVRTFLDDVLEAGGGEHFDIMNFHIYPPFAPYWGAPNGPGLLEKAQAVRNKLAEHDLEKPMVITESGMHSNDAPQLPMTPELQARYVVQLFTQNLAANVDVMIWWMLYDAGGDYPFENGLVTSIGSTNGVPVKKPSYLAYQVAAHQFNGVRFDTVLPTTETGNADLQVYRFVRDASPGTLYVAWLGAVDTTQTVPLQLSASQATLRDIYGAINLVTDGADGVLDGRITIRVSGQPVYVEVP